MLPWGEITGERRECSGPHRDFCRSSAL